MAFKFFASLRCREWNSFLFVIVQKHLQTFFSTAQFSAFFFSIKDFNDSQAQLSHFLLHDTFLRKNVFLFFNEPDVHMWMDGKHAQNVKVMIITEKPAIYASLITRAERFENSELLLSSTNRVA